MNRRENQEQLAKTTHIFFCRQVEQYFAAFGNLFTQMLQKQKLMFGEHERMKEMRKTGHD